MVRSQRSRPSRRGVRPRAKGHRRHAHDSGDCDHGARRAPPPAWIRQGVRGMKIWYIPIVSIALIATALTGAAVAMQPDTDEQRALRARIEQRYDVVPLSEG